MFRKKLAQKDKFIEEKLQYLVQESNETPLYCFIS
jgi:hypothetical protein